MAEPFIGEIRMFASSYVPRGWAECNGQIIPTQQNQALYAVIGNTYGGSSPSQFALPDMRGRVPIQYGIGRGLNINYPIGTKKGDEGITLDENQIPIHNHTFTATKNDAISNDPTGLYPSKHKDTTQGLMYRKNPEPLNAQFSPAAVGDSGASVPHENRQPFLTVLFGIALDGIFPSRS